MKGKSNVVFARGIGSIGSWIVLAITMVLAVVFSLTTKCTSAAEPTRLEQQEPIIRGIFADKHLWLLSSAGTLSSVEESGDTRVAQDSLEPVLDLCVSGGFPTVISADHGPTWTLSRWENKKWSTLAAIPIEGDKFLSINCVGNTEKILTSKRLIELGEGGNLRTVSLSARLHHGMVSASYEEGQYLFVGINAGEWGGGLERIDEDTGQVTSIERNASGELCGGPLNSECDPVNGVAAEPWNPHCMAVAVGLVHMMAQGRIVEVCGDNIRTLYTKPIKSSFWASLPKGKGPTVAFFGLTADGGALWAVGIDGLYRIDQSGAVTISPLPHFKTVGGVEVSFDNPGMILIVTSENESHSVSGSTPMLVPR
jgi:hypothetical protein